MQAITDREAAALEQAINDVIDANRWLIDDDSHISIPLFIAAVQAGRVEPDDNDGRITSWAGQMAFGAFMSAGDWWIKSDSTVTEGAEDINLNRKIELFEGEIDFLAGRVRPRGYKWELHRDFWVDDVTEDNVAALAAECLNAWHADRTETA